MHTKWKAYLFERLHIDEKRHVLMLEVQNARKLDTYHIMIKSQSGTTSLM